MGSVILQGRRDSPTVLVDLVIIPTSPLVDVLRVSPKLHTLDTNIYKQKPTKSFLHVLSTFAMNSPSLYVFFGTLLILFGSISTVSAAHSNVSCGKVFDGLTNAHHDLQQQTSLSTIGANWIDFGPSILFYEWAIISDRFNLPNSRIQNRCFDNIRSTPDVQSWNLVGKATSGINTNLDLSVGRNYYVLVRATDRDGRQIVSVSNGVEIVPQTAETESKTTARSNRSQQQTKNVDDQPSCQIDQENQCRKAGIPVRDLLNEVYGQAYFEPNRAEYGVYIPVPGQFAVIETNDGDDDDLNGYAWAIAPIVGGIILLLLCCLLLFLLAALLLRGSLPERDSSPKAAPVAFEEAEREKKGYGVRGDVGAGNVDSGTRVEFPDTQIRRLSISR